jgi:predicted ArsR family transcriptional regulator
MQDLQGPGRILLMSRIDQDGPFASTGGKLLLSLCRGPRTVNELMADLAVTDNAVRAQLANLQEAGLIRQVGLRPGTRKPHVEYELTPKARRLFPQAHEQVLGVLVGVLRDRLPPEQMNDLLKEVARRVIGGRVGELRAAGPRRRLAELFRRISGVPAGVSLEEEGDRTIVRACGCPLASVTAQHPEVCATLAEVLGELLGTTVRDRCDRQEAPRCCFELDADAPA